MTTYVGIRRGKRLRAASMLKRELPTQRSLLLERLAERPIRKWRISGLCFFLAQVTKRTLDIMVTEGLAEYDGEYYALPGRLPLREDPDPVRLKPNLSPNPPPVPTLAELLGVVPEYEALLREAA